MLNVFPVLKTLFVERNPMTLTVGIDLGTTNSALAIKTLTTRVVPNAEGEDFTPSCVTVHQKLDGEVAIIVGRPARDLVRQYPAETVLSVKRLLGRDFDEPEVQKFLTEKRYGYAIETVEAEPGAIQIPLAGSHFTPEAISSLILKKIIKDGSKILDGSISQAVVTVPAYFSDRQKFATRAACEQAGIKVLRLLPEPTAAAIAFCSENAHDAKTIMVFDLGGGTFDLSVLSIVDGQYMEVTKGGDMWLGGDDIDVMLRNLVFEHAQKSLGCAPIGELMDRLDATSRIRFTVEIKELCERAKISLSFEDEANIQTYGLLKDENNKLVDIDVTITRQDFDDMLKPLVKNLVQMTEYILEDIRFEPGLIDEVLLVGGSSCIPAIQQALKEKFGDQKVKIHARPLFAIAEGAAIMAHRLASNVDSESASLNLMHSVVHDYYLQLANASRHRLVARNSPLPSHVEEQLIFSQPGQDLARLRVFNDVDGILDAVGELWFYRDQGGVFEEIGREKSTQKTAIILKFEIDEDNIIRLNASRAEDSAYHGSAAIARGGLPSKLFADLERVLSEAGTNMSNNTFRYALRLSKLIAEQIPQVADSVTGVINHTLKKRIYAQIQTLAKLCKGEIDPLPAYHFAKDVKDFAFEALRPDDRVEIIEIVQNLRAAIEDLTDFNRLDSLVKQWMDFGEDDDVTVDIIKAVSIAKEGLTEWPGISKKLKSHIAAIGVARANDDQIAIKLAHDAIQDILSQFVNKEIVAKHSFDRDVTLANQ